MKRVPFYTLLVRPLLLRRRLVPFTHFSFVLASSSSSRLGTTGRREFLIRNRSMIMFLLLFFFGSLWIISMILPPKQRSAKMVTSSCVCLKRERELKLFVCCLLRAYYIKRLPKV